MVRIAAFALLLLASCDQSSTDRTDRLFDDIERDSRITMLESQAQAQQREIAELRQLTRAAADDTAALRGTVNHNARISNENAAKDMTGDGLCGREWVVSEQGYGAWRNKPCTTANLRKDS